MSFSALTLAAPTMPIFARALPKDCPAKPLQPTADISWEQVDIKIQQNTEKNWDCFEWKKKKKIRHELTGKLKEEWQKWNYQCLIEFTRKKRSFFSPLQIKSHFTIVLTKLREHSVGYTHTANGSEYIILIIDGNAHHITGFLVGRVFTNGPGDLSSIPGCVIPKTLKMVLDTSLLNTQQYKVYIKGKVEQSRETSCPLPYTSV